MRDLRERAHALDLHGLVLEFDEVADEPWVRWLVELLAELRRPDTPSFLGQPPQWTEAVPSSRGPPA